jgi:pyrroline-5-carboxylate reductase
MSKSKKTMPIESLPSPVLACIQALDQTAVTEALDEDGAFELVKEALAVAVQVMLRADPDFAGQVNAYLEPAGWRLDRVQ